ncbi:hypothetical protein FQN50_001850 [Emmonsiellopsis sp. PD_5]|nr:hypothetical protein FQN50_001850 [Emmonsiellopsis sp. PD_5]
MCFADLPGDVLLCIADQFDLYKDINSLACSYQFAYRNLNPYLYRRAKNFIVFLSATDGRDATLRRALQEGITAHGTTVAQRQTPLLLAIQKGHLSTVKILLQVGGVDVHAKDSLNGWDALLYAVNIGRVDILTTLLEATTYDRDALGAALVHAANIGNKDGFDVLYNCKDVNLNMPNSHGETALIRVMCLDYCMNIAKVLIRDDKVNLNCETALTRTTPLSYFASKGNTEMVEYLLRFRDRVDILHLDFHHQTALHGAVKHRSVPICKLLLEACPGLINIGNSVGNTPLTVALQPTRLPCGATRSDRGELLNALIDHGKVDWGQRCSQGATILLHAASSSATISSSETILFKRVLEAAGDEHLSDRDNSGHTPLLLAAKAGKHRTVQFLVRIKAIDPNQRNNAGETALMLAAKENCKDTVRVLLATKRTDINARDKEGLTPLIHAVTRASPEIVGLLLKVPGIEVNQRDSLGWTPLIWTRSKEFEFDSLTIRPRIPAITTMLISHGAVKDKAIFGSSKWFLRLSNTGDMCLRCNLYTPDGSRRDLKELI